MPIVSRPGMCAIISGVEVLSKALGEPERYRTRRGELESSMATASQAGAQALRLSEQELVQRDWTRIRFGIAIGIMAAGIGAATTILNLYTEFEGIGALERLPPGQAVLFGIAGAFGGFLVGGPASYWLYGVRPTFSLQGRRARRLWVWLMLAIVFVFFYCFLTGGVFLPIARYFFLYLSSVMSVPNVVGRFFDLFTASWLVFGVKNAFFLLGAIPPWPAIGGAVFGPCAWGIDKLSTSASVRLSKYGPITLATVIGLIVLIFAALGPK